MEKKQRPKVVPSQTEKIPLAECGNIYITVTYDEGEVFEVFAYPGKSENGEQYRPCIKCYLEGLTRAITIGLRYGVPLKAYIKQLSAIDCGKNTWTGDKTKIKSCVDAIAIVLQKKEKDGSSKM
jgi:hypothetical protein